MRPLCRGLAAAGVSANAVTILAAALSVGLGVLIARQPGEKWPLLIVPGFLFLRMALNAIDGMLAREHGMKSKLGAILNELGDVVADTALYLPFALVPGFTPWQVVVFVILAMLTEMMGVVSVQIGASRRYDGPMGKSDRAFVFGVLALLLGLGLEIESWLSIIFDVLILLTAWTVINRGRRSLAEAR